MQLQVARSLELLEPKNQQQLIHRDPLQAGKDVLFDDRDERAGVKFNDADMVGIPTQIIVGERSLKEGKVEVKDRRTGETKLVELHSIISSLS